MKKTETKRTPEQLLSRFSSRVFTIALFVFIVLALLTAMLLGTNIYNALTNSRFEASTIRLESSLLLNTVRSNDVQGALSVQPGPEGDALVLTETTSNGTYETRLYRYQGNLVEEYAIAGDTYTPGRASQVCQTDEFDVDLTRNLITIKTDMGTTNISFRSDQEVS
ncbi:MAG: DUF4860 domain-containing protein [Anaerotardibacter sp.]